MPKEHRHVNKREDGGPGSQKEIGKVNRPEDDATNQYEQRPVFAQNRDLVYTTFCMAAL